MLLAALSTPTTDPARDAAIPFDRSLLTTAAQAWLASHPAIYEAETQGAIMAPLTFRDGHGVYVGITADYVMLLAQRLGIKIERVEHPTVDAAIAAVTAGHADFIGSIVATPEQAGLMNLS
jgi:two-component system sensor histidine kinase/response regulator